MAQSILETRESLGPVHRVAVISDVHANLDALDAVLHELEADEIWCLGDLVGYGARPGEVISRLKEVGAKSLMGNHDYAAATGDTGGFNARAAMAAVWTRNSLTKAEVQFLASLPTELVQEVEGLKIYLAHGSPDDQLWEYVDPRTHEDLFPHYLTLTRASVIGLGHTHVPYSWKGRRGLVFNPGSVGQPRDGDPRASYARITFEGGDARVEHRRVVYDWAAAGRRIREAGLPAQLADRLAAGL